jgi:sulfate transport system permease protein
VRVIFSLPGIVLATVFVSLPFVVREGGARAARGRHRPGAGGVHARRERLAGVPPHHAAVDRWGVAYGVVLSTARALGEFGAVSIVSGKVSGETETMTLLVEKRFQNFDLAGAYAASTLLAVIALLTLLAMTVFDRRRKKTL